MKKGHYTIIILAVGLVLFSGLLSIEDNDNSTKKEIVYNGNNLRVSIDGVSSNTLPTSGNYYLVNYDCKDKNTVLSWDMDNHKLNVSNGNKGKSIACYLEFKSNPKLSEMPVGSYVAYEGVGGTVGSTSVACKNGGSLSSSVETDEAESANSCLGQNAREDLNNLSYIYGYCYSSSDEFYATGWRIAYIDDNKPVIISGGSPECNARTSSVGNIDYIKLANTKAMKYCNNDFVDGDCSCLDSDADGYCDCTDNDKDGLCDEVESKKVNAWAINDYDFYNITKAISGVGKGISNNGSNLGDVGGTIGDKKYCVVAGQSLECGYNNDLIDNGGLYWLASVRNNTDNDGIFFNTNGRRLNSFDSTNAYGLRPVISLSSSVIVLGGKGTMDSPYIIGNNTFSINGGKSYIGSNDDTSNVILNLIGTDNVSQMCISVDSSACSNYIDFAETYTLDWSSEEDGEKEVYVYYKDSAGNIIASMNKSIIIDTSGPGEGSISFVDGDGLSRTINVYSKGANYMCLSNTSNNIGDCNEWVEYSKTYNWSVEQGVGSKTVYAFFKDEAGNTIGPYSATTTCTNDCEYKYFMDAYNDNNVYIVRNDGATAMATTTSIDVTWYSKNTQKMKICGADNYYNSGANAYIWCIGEDNNVYYKIGYNNTWNKVSIAANIDTATYDYSIYPYSDSYAYIIRSDGRTNRMSPTGLASTSWNYGYSREMATCSGYANNRVVCLGKDGKYYYSTDYTSTSDYSGGEIVNLTDRTNENSWIDMYYNTNTNIIESDGTNLYTTRFAYNSVSTIWHSSSIPGEGVEYCASGGYSTNNYCLAKDGYLYYKSYDATSWTKSSLKYE